MVRIGDDPRQPRRIENAFLKIKLPGTVLLRHELSLQAVGEARNDALKMRQLLVEITAQSFEFFGVAKIFGRNGFVEARSESVIFRAPRLIVVARLRTGRFAGRIVVAKFAVIDAVAGLRLRAIHGRVGHFVRGSFGLFGAHFIVGLTLRDAFSAGLLLLSFAFLLLALLVGLHILLVAELKRIEHVMNLVAEAALIFDEALRAIEPRPDFPNREPVASRSTMRRAAAGIGSPVNRSRTIMANASARGASARSVISSNLPRWK